MNFNVLQLFFSNNQLFYNNEMKSIMFTIFQNCYHWISDWTFLNWCCDDDEILWSTIELVFFEINVQYFVIDNSSIQFQLFDSHNNVLLNWIERLKLYWWIVDYEILYVYLKKNQLDCCNFRKVNITIEYFDDKIEILRLNLIRLNDNEKKQQLNQYEIKRIVNEINTCITKKKTYKSKIFERSKNFRIIISRYTR